MVLIQRLVWGRWRGEGRRHAAYPWTASQGGAHFVLLLLVVWPTGLTYHQSLKADIVKQGAQCREKSVGFVHWVTYRLHRGQPTSDIVPPYHRVEWNAPGLAPVIKALGKGQPEEAMHYQISVYLMRLTLIEMVKEPAVSVKRSSRCAATQETLVLPAQVVFFAYCATQLQKMAIRSGFSLM